MAIEQKYKRLYAVYKGAAGDDGDIKRMEDLENLGILEKDILYKVTKINMGSAHTTIKLLNIDGSFNSIAFSFYEVTKDRTVKCDIYDDARFNPYIGSTSTSKK